MHIGIVHARRRAWVLCAALAGAVLAHGAAAQSVRPLQYARTTLPNGLVLLVNEDHSTPVVAVDVWYHFGAKNEQPGKTGLAHLCEHLMGEGSPNEPLPAKVFIQSLGGTSVRWAETSEDVMHFYATVPANQLEPMLWLESDRMAAPLSKADAAHVESVREVIHQERVQNRESPVFGLANSIVVQWVLDAPYQIDPLGPMADLNTVTAQGALNFCGPYFVPNNAVIALSGDVTAAAAQRLVAKYFGPIARRADPPRVVVNARRTIPTSRLVLEDVRGRSPVLRMAWPGASYANPDRLALNALGDALTRDRVGRLSKLLVYDRGLATSVFAGDIDMEKSGVFQVQVAPRPNASLGTIEQLVDSVLADVVIHPLTALELESVKRRTAMGAVFSLQTRAARADTLAHDEIFTGNPVAYADQITELMALTPADIARVAKAYLDNGHIVMSMIPQGKLDLIAQPGLPYTNVTPVTPKGTP